MRQFQVNQDSTAQYTAYITDENAAPIPVADLTSIKLTLKNADTGVVINARDQQDVKNLNGVAIDSDGMLVWTMEPEDNPLIDTTRKKERHRALFEFVFGSKQGSHEFEIFVNKTGI